MLKAAFILKHMHNRIKIRQNLHLVENYKRVGSTLLIIRKININIQKIYITILSRTTLTLITI